MREIMAEVSKGLGFAPNAPGGDSTMEGMADITGMEGIAGPGGEPGPLPAPETIEMLGGEVPVEEGILDLSDDEK